MVGIRPTVGLVSRHGVAPLVREQDTPGPLARSVADAAALLDAMTDWDHRDPSTALPATSRPHGAFRDSLTPGALSGARIGVLRDLCATRPGDDSEIARITENSLASMREAGAALIDVHLPGLPDLLRGTFMYFHQSRRDLSHWLTTAGSRFIDVADIVASGQSSPAIALLRGVAASRPDPDEDPALHRALELRVRLQQLIAGAFAEHSLSALVYPTVRIPAPLRADIDAGAFEDSAPHIHNPESRAFPSNTLLAAQSAFPAITIPTGTTSTALPAGLEFLGLPHRDAKLIALAFDLERIRPPRPVPVLATTHLGGAA